MDRAIEGIEHNGTAGRSGDLCGNIEHKGVDLAGEVEAGRQQIEWWVDVICGYFCPPEGLATDAEIVDATAMSGRSRAQEVELLINGGLGKRRLLSEALELTFDRDLAGLLLMAERALATPEYRDYGLIVTPHGPNPVAASRAGRDLLWRVAGAF